MGERDHFIAMEMASIGMEMMAEWGAAAIGERLAMLTARLAAGLRDSAEIPDARGRSPHLLCVAFPAGMPNTLIDRLAAENIHVARRLGRIRLSPHVYNDEADVDRFIAVFVRLMRSSDRA